MKKTIEQIFAENLRARRKELCLTQKALAERISYSEKSISKWENGDAIAPSDLLPALADVLHCSVDELLRDVGEPGYFLGIDGGGTKTEFLLCDAHGHQIAHAILGACNPNDVGMTTTQQVLREGILTVCDGIPLRKISVFAGLAGGITGDNAAKIGAFLSSFRFARTANGSDAQNAVAVALGRQDGITVIAGTGSIAFSQKDGALYRHCGFGYLLEEGGSGFTIGRDAIRAALMREAGCGPDTLLSNTVRKKCGGDTVLGALGRLYEGGKREFASFAPLVFDAYQKGDAVAADILHRNAKEIARLIEIAAGTFEGAPCDVILVGGLTHHAAVLLPLIQSHLTHADSYRLSSSDAPIVNGALRLAGLENI